MGTRSAILKDLEDVKAVFDKYGVKFVVGYGALLGWYRDKDFIEGDDDIDISIVEPVDFKTKKAIGWTLYDLGFQPQNIAFNVFGRMEPIEIGYNGDEETGIIVCERNFKFTIFFMKEVDCDMHGKEMLCIPKLGAMRLISSPSKFYKKYGEIKIGGKKYLTPSPIEDYLNFSYFNNWKDRTDRRHSPTFPEAHAVESITKDDANGVMIQ